MTSSTDLAAVRDACLQFPHRFQSLHLGTCSTAGEPEASYAPFVHAHGSYYVYVSDLARHTTNLRSTQVCSVLFIEPENDAKHLFARERLTLRCTARACERDSAIFDDVLDLFAARFGKFMEIIRPLEDFQLFELTPHSGTYVAGFAKAYSLEGQDLAQIQHRQDQGHRSPDSASAHRLSVEVSR